MTNTDKPTDIEIDHHAGTVPYDILSALQEIDESAHPDNALTLGDWGLLEQNPNLHLYVAKQRLVLHNEPADEIVGFCVAQIFGATEIERLVVTPEFKPKYSVPTFPLSSSDSSFAAARLKNVFPTPEEHVTTNAMVCCIMSMLPKLGSFCTISPAKSVIP
jgi:hypothetical protein